MSIQEDIPLTSQSSDVSISQEEGSMSGKSTMQTLRKRNKEMKRVPLKDQNMLEFPREEGYHYHEFIDRGDRLERCKRAGYTFVAKPKGTVTTRSKDPSNIGKYISRIVGTIDGRDVRAYVMRIPSKYYEEDQKAKQVEIDRRMRAAQRIQGVPEKQAYGKVKIDQTLE